MADEVVAELDTSGLVCPMPILRLKQALRPLCSGHRIRVIATDPDSQSDFAAFAAQTGHRLLESRADAGVYYYLLEKV